MSSLQALDSVDKVDTNIRIFGNTFCLGVARVWFVKRNRKPCVVKLADMPQSARDSRTADNSFNCAHLRIPELRKTFSVAHIY